MEREPLGISTVASLELSLHKVLHAALQRASAAEPAAVPSSAAAYDRLRRRKIWRIDNQQPERQHLLLAHVSGRRGRHHYPDGTVGRGVGFVRWYMDACLQSCGYYTIHIRSLSLQEHVHGVPESGMGHTVFRVSQLLRRPGDLHAAVAAAASAEPAQAQPAAATISQPSDASAVSKPADAAAAISEPADAASAISETSSAAAAASAAAPWHYVLLSGSASAPTSTQPTSASSTAALSPSITAAAISPSAAPTAAKHEPHRTSRDTVQRNRISSSKLLDKLV